MATVHLGRLVRRLRRAAEASGAAAETLSAPLLIPFQLGSLTPGIPWGPPRE
jgi:hypothetical protein